MQVWNSQIEEILPSLMDKAGLVAIEPIINRLEDHLERVDDLAKASIPEMRDHYEGIAEGLVIALVELGAPINSR